MPSVADRRVKWAWAVLLGAALFLRFYKIDLPFVEPYNSLTRQSIVATVARNFYEHGFNFFYPEINENGTGPYFYNAEMPFYSYAMAFGYWLAGGVREWVARAVSVAVFFAGMFLLCRLTMRLFGRGAALGAAVILVFSPWWMALSRSIQPEATLFFASAGTIAAFYEYAVTGRRRWFAASVVLGFLAVATKVTSLYLFVPVACLAWSYRKERSGMAAAYGIWLAALLLPLAWYVCMWKAGTEHVLAYEPYKLSKKFKNGMGLSLPQILFSAASLHPLKVFFIHNLMPVGILGLAAGAVRAVRGRVAGWFWMWIVASLGSCLVLWRAVIPHPYYLLPFMIPSLMLAGWGLEALFLRMRSGSRFVFLGALTLFAAANLVLAGHFYAGLYNIPEEGRMIVEAGRAVDRISPPDSLIASYVNGGSPIQLYYSHRKGWRFNMYDPGEERMIADMKANVRSGARYFVTSSVPEFEKLKLFSSYMKTHHRPVEQKPGYVIYELRPEAASP